MNRIEMINIIIPVISGILGTISVLLFFALKIGKYIEKIHFIEKESGSLQVKIVSLVQQTAIIDSVIYRINRLEGYFDTSINEKMKERNSPVSLTPYAIQVLKDIEFYKIFDLIKEKLCKRLDEYNLRTKYDVQEMSDFLMRKIRDDELCDPLKQAAFAKGYNLDEILSAASIPLRDYYLSIHPEIKD